MELGEVGFDGMLHDAFLTTWREVWEDYFPAFAEDAGEHVMEKGFVIPLRRVGKPVRRACAKGLQIPSP